MVSLEKKIRGTRDAFASGLHSPLHPAGSDLTLSGCSTRQRQPADPDRPTLLLAVVTSRPRRRRYVFLCNAKRVTARQTAEKRPTFLRHRRRVENSNRSEIDLDHWRFLRNRESHNFRFTLNTKMDATQQKVSLESYF